MKTLTNFFKAIKAANNYFYKLCSVIFIIYGVNCYIAGGVVSIKINRDTL